MDPDLQQARDRLVSFVGEERAARSLARALSGEDGPMTPDGVCAIAEALIRMGDVEALVGRALRLQALRRGARVA